MLSQKMDPSLHFYKHPNKIVEIHGEKVYQKGKKYVQVIDSTVMSNPWRNSGNKKRIIYELLFQKMDPSLHFSELPNTTPQTHGIKL